MNICWAVIIALAFCGAISWALETEAQWRWEAQDRERDDE